MPVPTERTLRRRPTARSVAVMWAVAGIAAIGAGLLWLRPPARVSMSGGSAAVIGAPGTAFPRTAVQPRRPAAHNFTPVPAPPFTLTVLSAGAAHRPSAATQAASPAPSVIPRAGAPLALAALRGHPVVINFWASWCAPCRAEMPMLVKASHAYAARGVVVLGLDVDDTPQDARRFLVDYGVDYPIVTVPNDRLPRAYGVIGLPTTVFVDAAGMIRARQVGQFDGPEGERTLTRDLDALVSGAAR